MLPTVNVNEIKLAETYDNKFDYNEAIRSVTTITIKEDPNDTELINRIKYLIFFDIPLDSSCISGSRTRSLHDSSWLEEGLMSLGRVW
jgi:hypothetical protein